MKKIVTFVVIASLVVSLAGCTEGKKEEVKQVEKVEVDENKVEIQINIPADYFNGLTEEEIIEEANETGIENCVVNEDGSVTYTMSVADKKKMLADMAVEYDQAIADIINDVDNVGSSFVEINHNEDFSAYEIKATDDYNEMDMFILLGMIYMASYYQIFSGVPEDEVDVSAKVVSDTTSEVLDSVTYKDIEDIIGDLG